MKTLWWIIALAAFALASPAAVDLSGKWTGSFNMTGPDGAVRESQAVAMLKHTGSELSGTAGPNEEEQYPIRKGTVAGDKIAFELVRSEDQIIRFDLVLAGERLTGQASMSANGQTVSAKVDWGRAK